MAWGKEEFRTKYKESNDCLEKIKDNYYDLDYEYQMIAKELQQKENIIKEVRNWVKSTIDIIKQQPTGNDEWILERLNSFISLLDKGE